MDKTSDHIAEINTGEGTFTGNSQESRFWSTRTPFSEVRNNSQTFLYQKQLATSIKRLIKVAA